MKFKKNFELRDICGEKTLIATGLENIDFSRIIALNEVAADVYAHFVEKEFTLDQAVSYVAQHYEGADEATIKTDLEKLFQDFRQNGILA